MNVPMKKTAILAAVLLLCFSFAAVGYGAGALYNGYPVVNLAINGKPVTAEVPAITMDGQTLVPLRFLIEELGYQVEYDSATSTVDIQLGKSPGVSELNASDFVDTKTIHIAGEPFCKAYKLPPPKDSLIVSEDSMRQLANRYGIEVTIEKDGWVFYGNGTKKKYYYEAKINNELYFAHGSILMILRYLVDDKSIASSFVVK